MHDLCIIIHDHIELYMQETSSCIFNSGSSQQKLMKNFSMICERLFEKRQKSEKSHKSCTIYASLCILQTPSLLIRCASPYKRFRWNFRLLHHFWHNVKTHQKYQKNENLRSRGLVPTIHPEQKFFADMQFSRGVG